MEKNSTNSNNLIDKEELINLLREHNLQRKRLNTLSEIGFPIWDTDLIEYGNLMFDRVIKAYFTDEGYDWICWWLYEKDGNPDMKAWDESGDEIPTDSFDDLWELVKDYRKI